MIVLEAFDREGKVYNEKSFTQELAEKVLKKGHRWRLKEGQLLVFKEGSLIHKAVKQEKKSETKTSKKADKE